MSRAHSSCGINRLSLGVQALNDADLKMLGRLHDVAEAKAALNLAMKNFPRVSLDLIYARPDQSMAQWRNELKQALSFGTDHLSLYQLTIEPQTPFSLLHQTGKLKIPDDIAAAEHGEAHPRGVLVSAVGFVADHLEVLYDLDHEAATICRDIGLAMTRAEAVNDDAVFVDMMADVVQRTIGRYRSGRPLPIVAPPGAPAPGRPSGGPAGRGSA